MAGAKRMDREIDAARSRRLHDPAAFATSIILLLTLIPFFAFRSLAEVVGGRVLFRLFFEPRRKLDVAPARAHSEGA
jgi:hypothetical protein